MESENKTTIIVDAIINAPIEVVWELWTTPDHIIKWNYASDDWHTPFAENDLRKGGKFLYRMEAKDGSFGFDFWGEYDRILTNKLIEYKIGDGRKVKIDFTSHGNETRIIQTFETESENSVEQQREGWQTILNNFSKYVQSEYVKSTLS
jgi:uncharacterized protein YndB with AHSA1/START domain